MITPWILVGLVALAHPAPPALAFTADDAAPITLVDVAGNPQPLSVDGVLTVALFLRPQQQWTEDAIADLARVRADLPAAERARTRLVAVWVQEREEERWTTLDEPWVELLDEDRRAARAQQVVAYPTTAILDGAGKTLFRLPSHPPEYARTTANALRKELGLPPLPAAEAGPVEPWRRHVHLAERLRDKGEPLAAIDALTEAERLGADRGVWLPVRSTLALDQGDLDGARTWIEELRTLAPDEPATTFLRGRLARLGGNFAEAEMLLRPLLALAPHRLDLVLDFGAVLEGLGKFEEAAALYRRALEGVEERGRE